MTIISFVHIAGVFAQEEPDPETTPPPDSEPLSTPPPESEPLSTPPPERLDLHVQALPPLPVPTPDPDQIVAPPPPPDTGIIDELLETEPPPPEPEPEFAPPLEPGPEIPPPPDPGIASFVPGESDSPNLEEAMSEIEVWREESQFPQMPARLGRQFAQTYLTGSEPVLVRLRFDPLAAGKTVIVKPGPGVTVEPAETEFHVGPTRECVLSVKLDGSFLRTDISVYCDGLRTAVPLSRASLEIVEAQEAATGGGQ